MNSLTRFRSAPSSYFATFLDASTDTTTTTTTTGGGDGGGVGGGGGGGGGGGERSNFPPSRPLSPETENIFARFMSTMSENNSSSSQNIWKMPENMPENQPEIKPEFMVPVKQETETLQQQPVLIYRSPSKPPLANRSHSNSTARDSLPSSLTRYSSSPAGFFSDINIDIDNVVLGQNLDIIGENKFTNSSGNNSITNTWDDSILSENLSSLEHHQRGESRNRPPLLAHHLSLPKTSAEMEKLLQLQDTVAFRTRAKRGFATHPRSIAERVRRTKISERMRKLQDLVPNMDKQTNTADMLDLAVEYIRYLQNQVKILNDSRATCTCSSI